MSGIGVRSGYSRRQVVAGGASALSLGQFVPRSCRAQEAPSRAISLAAFGAVGDGEADDGPALARALAEAGRLNLPLHVPRGTFLILDTHVFAGGAPFAPHRGLTIQGAGSGSVLRFRRANFSAFYGLTIRNDDVHIRDVTLEVDRNGGSWTAAVCATQPIRNLRFTRVLFRGLGGRTGNYGMLPDNADIDGLAFDHCHFEGLDFGFLKQTPDVSTQTNITITDCTGRNCTTVFEFNSPGLFFGDARAGSAIVTGIAVDGGGAFDTGKLKPGQLVRSAQFPPGTRVVSIDSGARITLSAHALVSTPSRSLGRFSAGGCRNGVVRNFRARNIGQWAIGFANCEDWQAEAYGEDIDYELVHVEDASRGIRIVAGGVRCNLRPGVVGSPRAANGMVQILTGSRDIAVTFTDADLTASRDGAANGLCVQAGGVMGTTGLEVDPRGITVGGRILLKSGTLAVVAYNSDIRFADLELVNPDPHSRADPMMRLAGCTWSGSIRVRNPGTLVEPHPLSRGRFDRVSVLS